MKVMYLNCGLKGSLRCAILGVTVTQLQCCNVESLNQGDQRSVFPPCVDKLKFADQMGQYFVEKIRNIHSKLDNLAFTLPIDPHDGGADVQPTVAQFTAFTTLSEDDVRQLMTLAKNQAV